jgi:FkbM family methyltransferase
VPFVSYAQNAEDVPLWRVFGGQPDGFYVDVGASGPDLSVTTAFYRRGWCGLNLEPAPHLFAELQTARPRDINIQMAASDTAGTATLFTDAGQHLGGLSTLSPMHADAARETTSFAGEPVTVPTATLAEMCERHVGRPIDFLKIDVEGHERAVIAGADWTRWRPRVVLVEATEPMSPTPSHQEWESQLLEAGYLFALFDGLNRFYVRDEDRQLIGRLNYPPCVFDDYVPARHQSELERLTAEYAKLSKDRDEVWWQLHHMRLRAEAAEAEVARLKCGGL